jgi:DNA modification methylase
VEVNRILQGNALDVLKTLPDASVQTVITSPPYWGGLRDYKVPATVWDGDDRCQHEWGEPQRTPWANSVAGPNGRKKNTAAGHWKSKESGQFCQRCGGWKGCLGHEPDPQTYVDHLVQVFREVRRVLRTDGTLWLNLGDTYWGKGPNRQANVGNLGSRVSEGLDTRNLRAPGLKNKDLVGIPWRVALALQADGWILRSDNVWEKPNCLSGGTILYTRTPTGETPVMVKDLMRRDPKTVELWNGEKWTQCLSWIQRPRPEHPLELELRSGQRIGCTPDHLWPTQRGIVRADELVLGDVIRTCSLPEPCQPKTPTQLPDEVGWLIGLYLAEGSRSGDCIQIAGHVKEAERYERLCRLAESYGGTCRLHRTGGNSATINLFGKVLNAIIDMYVAGHTARDKHLATLCWQRSNAFLEMALLGYLSGDGHYEKQKERWRIGFTRNYFLENDLRTLCARLGIRLILNPSTAKFGEKAYPSFKGEIRLSRGTHPNNKEAGEVLRIGRSRARQFWDIAVADDPHLFALASGVLTHNCQPESCKDRPTKSHEYVFLFSKAPRYFYDADAVREPHTMKPQRRLTQRHSARDRAMRQDKQYRYTLRNEPGVEGHPAGRNRRTVWSINTAAFDARRLGIGDVQHFACVDEETECLTLTGWKKYPQLRRGEMLAAFNMDTGCLQYEPLQDIAVFDYDGDMYKLGNRDLDALCTPNHRCIVRDRITQKVGIRRADDLVRGLEVPCAAPWSTPLPVEGVHDPGPVVAELLGWVLTEANWEENPQRIRLYQSLTAHPQKVERIRSLLDATSWPYTEHTRTRQPHRLPQGTLVKRAWQEVRFALTGPGYACLQELVGGGSPGIPQPALFWSEESVKALLDGIIQGDGHTRSDDGRISVVQKDPAFIDMVQLLALRLGYRCIVSERKSQTGSVMWTAYITQRQWISLRGTGGKGAAIEKVSYQGRVWCPSLPSGTFVARRRGRIWITGNTMPPTLAELCVLASTSPQACEICGAPWRRRTAKETHFEGGSGRAGRNPEELNARGKWEQCQHGKNLKLGPVVEIQTVGWCPTCKCAGSKGLGRCLVLDPFAGAGTVLAMAAHLGRDYLGIELNAQYLSLAKQNILTPLNIGIRQQPAQAEHDGNVPAGIHQLLLLDEEEP